MSLLLCALLAGEPLMADFRDLQSDTWVAADGLGRVLPGHAGCGPPRANRTVGIFYFLWMNHGAPAVHDLTEIVAANPADPPYGPLNAFHWWGRPRLGYYTSDDEVVIRRHAQMLTDAGVDFIAFDVTNALTYDPARDAVCRVFAEIRAEGRTTPQITFLANSASARTVQHLYETFYQPGHHADLWFRWQGKPLLMAPREGLSPEILDFFTLRQSWAWTNPGGWFGDGRDKWPWLDHHPQNPGWHESPERPEQIAVTTGQHATSNIGRSFHDGRQPPPAEQRPELGLCFAEQWDRAIEVDPEVVFITGWNEWIAQHFKRPEGGGPGEFLGRPLPVGGTFFVDQYSAEYSRDIEPMAGGWSDAYYYQMVAGIRRFKGVRPVPRATPPVTIDLAGDPARWAAVGPEYLDDAADTRHRDHPGYGDAGPQRNLTGRNDIVSAKVARDAESIYFQVTCREPITAPGERWMWLLIDLDGRRDTGWEGYDLIVNRTFSDRGESLLEANAGGWSWRPVAPVRRVIDGASLRLAVPRAALGLAADPVRFDFKWADNVPESGDIADFIDQGDVAPNGRFNYRYES